MKVKFRKVLICGVYESKKWKKRMFTFSYVDENSGFTQISRFKQKIDEKPAFDYGDSLKELELEGYVNNDNKMYLTIPDDKK